MIMCDMYGMNETDESVEVKYSEKLLESCVCVCVFVYSLLADGYEIEQSKQTKNFSYKHVKMSASLANEI